MCAACVYLCGAYVFVCSLICERARIFRFDVGRWLAKMVGLHGTLCIWDGLFGDVRTFGMIIMYFHVLNNHTHTHTRESRAYEQEHENTQTTRSNKPLSASRSLFCSAHVKQPLESRTTTKPGATNTLCVCACAVRPAAERSTVRRELIIVVCVDRAACGNRTPEKSVTPSFVVSDRQRSSSTT